MMQDSSFELSLNDFSRRTQLPITTIRALVGSGIVEPHMDGNTWYFAHDQINRCQIATHLHRELHLNLHGVALALELLDRNRHLQRRLNHLEHLLDRLQNQQ